MRGMVIVLIRTKLRPDANLAEYERLNAEMFALVSSIPSFLGAEGYTSEAGEEVGMIKFGSLAALQTWRDHPDHVVVQRRGREEFYASLRIEVYEQVRAYDFTAVS